MHRRHRPRRLEEVSAVRAGALEVAAEEEASEVALRHLEEALEAAIPVLGGDLEVLHPPRPLEALIAHHRLDLEVARVVEALEVVVGVALVLPHPSLPLPPEHHPFTQRLALAGRPLQVLRQEEWLLVPLQTS